MQKQQFQKFTLHYSSNMKPKIKKSYFDDLINDKNQDKNIMVLYIIVLVTMAIMLFIGLILIS